MAPFHLRLRCQAVGLLLSLLAGCGPAGEPYHAGPTRPAAPGIAAAPRPADWTAYHLVPARVAAVPPDLLRQLRRAAGGDFAMANAGEDFQATDAGFNRRLPTRRLCLLATTGPKWLLVYEQGGIAHSYHVVRCVLVNKRATAISNCSLGQKPATLNDVWAGAPDCPVGRSAS